MAEQAKHTATGGRRWIVARQPNAFVLAVWPTAIFGEDVARDAAQAMARDLGRNHFAEVRDPAAIAKATQP